MSRINIRYHKNQPDAIINSMSTAIKKLKSYPWMMTRYEMQLMRERAELDKAILEVCMVSGLAYEQVSDVVQRISVTGHPSVNVALAMRDIAMEGGDLKILISGDCRD